MSLNPDLLASRRFNSSPWRSLRNANGFYQYPDKFTAAAPFVFLIASLMVLVFGAGRISADTALVFLYGSGGVKEADSVVA